jgi:hypothetical protein
MSAKYLQSVNEIRQWLSYKKLDEFIYILVDNGYDDLDSMSRMYPQEINELENLFQTPDSRKAIQILVQSLCQVGIDAYRRQKNEFRRLIQVEEQQQGHNQFNLGQNQNNNAPQHNMGQGMLNPDQIPPSPALQQLASGLQQAELYLQQAQAQLIGKNGYCAVRTHPENPWSDKYVALEGTELRFFTSRRDEQPEIVYQLVNNLQAVDKPDPTTVVLSLANAGTIELGYDNPQETDEW